MPRRALSFACAVLAARSAAGALQAESELTHSCFSFPAKNFNRANCVKSEYGHSPHTAGGLSEGESAYDFTLSDLSGKSYTLSTLLEEKPVVLVWGMWTCPAYQGLGQEAPFDQCSYQVRASRLRFYFAVPHRLIGGEESSSGNKGKHTLWRY